MKKKNSWLYAAPFLNDTLVFDCQCGHKRTVLLSNDIIFQCTHCNNQYFIQYGFKNYVNYTKYFQFDFNTNFQNHSGWTMLVYTHLPLQIQLLNGMKDSFHEIAEFHVDIDGNFYKKIFDKELAFKRICSQKYQNIIEITFPKFIQYILQSQYFNLHQMRFPLFPRENLNATLRKIQFFLKHPSLTEIPFYYFDFRDISTCTFNNMSFEEALLYILGSNKKSLKKAFFLTFEHQKKKQERYNPIFDIAFKESFTDFNYLSKLIALPQEEKSKLCIHIDNNETFVIFLSFLRQHYSQKQLFNMLQNALKGYHKHYFQNSMMMFECEPKAITHYFNTTKATMKAIYQEITRVLIEKLNYPEYVKEAFIYSRDKSKR